MQDEELIEVELDLDKETLLSLALAAHERNKTLNALIIEVLSHYAEIELDVHGKENSSA